MKVIERIVEYLDNLAWKLSPHPAFPTGEPVCNVSDETNEWNKRALEYAWKPGNGIVPEEPRRKFSAEEMDKMQQETYRLNAIALDYSRDHKTK